MMKAGRIGTLIFWAVVLVALAGVLPPPHGPWMVKVGAIILLAHIGEVVLMYTLLRDQAKPEPKDVPLVLLFGAFHLRPKLVANRQQASGEQEGK